MYTTPSSPGEPLLDYVDVDQPVVSARAGRLTELEFDTALAPGNHLSKAIALRPGTVVQSNLLAPPALVHVGGARIIGINGETGADVLEVGPPSRSPGSRTGPSSPRTITVSPAASLPVILGRVLTLCGLAALAGQLLFLGLRRRRSSAR
jgi:hypothetical protein